MKLTAPGPCTTVESFLRTPNVIPSVKTGDILMIVIDLVYTR